MRELRSIAMVLDLRVRVGVALILAAGTGTGCGPTVRPDKPPGEPSGPGVSFVPPSNPRPPGRQILVGEMCPKAAAGRPGVAPLVVRGGVEWTAAPDAVADPIARGTARKFAVVGYDG